MGISQMIKKHNVTIATIVNNIDWVITRAREIDLDNELFLARELDIIMVFIQGVKLTFKPIEIPYNLIEL